MQSNKGNFCAFTKIAFILLFAILLTGGSSLFADPNLPNGFVLTPVVTSFPQVTDIAFAPDGRIFVAQKTGQVRIVKNGQLLSTPFCTVTVDQSAERGLDGLTLDPNFATNGYVYICYTATSPTTHNRLSRFTANGDVAAVGETVLFEGPTLGTSGFHNGNCPRFGPDGKLYMSIGDNNQATPAQSMTNLLGKIVRLNPDGTIPTDNPFYNTASDVYRAIWALGVRNPFKMTFQPGTGRMFINDVGNDFWEEINDGIAGSNYGWPYYEGYSNSPGYTSPLYAYPHTDNVGSNYPNPSGCAITGGAFYNPPVQQFPSMYVGKYFFCDYCDGWIGLFDPATNTVTKFATGLTSLVDIKTAPDGSMYILEIADATGAWGSGGLYHLTYTGSLSPQIGQQPGNLTVPSGAPATFSITAFGDQPLNYQWQRDGTSILSATNSSYTLQPTALSDNGANFNCVVSNSFGTASSGTATLTVIQDQPPICSILTPVQTGSNQNIDNCPYSPLMPADQLYSAGDTISFSGTASDPEDGNLPASAYTWQVDFHHHLTTGAHIHPFISAFSGVMNGSFSIPTTGETNDDVWYRISLTITDSAGVSTTTYRDVMPAKSTFILATNQSGLQLTLDGQTYAAPLTTLGVVNLQRTIGAPSPQTVNGTTYVFDSWSDGGAATHAIATPASDTTFTANYHAVQPTALGNGATFISQSVPATMTAGNYYNVSVTMYNSGTSTWQPGVHRLGAQNPSDNTTWGAARLDIASPVSPGQTATFTAQLPAPNTSGTTNFQWQMVQEGVEWFGDLTPNVAVNIAKNDATFMSQTVPATMAAGQSYYVSVTMQNTGSTTWTPDQNYKLAVDNTLDSSRWGITRVYLPSGTSVAPGQSYTFNFSVTAPITTGTCNFQWRMLQTGVQYFGQDSTAVAVRIGAQPTDGAAFYFQNVPTTMVAGQTYGIQVIMTNSGSSTWSETNLFRLGSQNPQDNTIWGRSRIYLPSGVTVAPGQNATFNFFVTAPTTPGTYNFQWRMVHDKVAWLGQVTPNVTVNVTPNPNQAAFVSQTVPTSVSAGVPTTVTVVMQNTGTTTWSESGKYRLGSQNPRDNKTWGFSRAFLSAPVAPGAQGTFTFTIYPPTTTGTYNFQWQMVQDGAAWFGDMTPNVPITVTKAATFVSQTVPATMSAGQSYNISITMLNSGTSTWSSSNGYKLGSQNPQDNKTWGFNRVALPSSVPAGSSVTFNFTVKAPSTPGNYNFQWRMLQSGVSWFGDFTPNVVVSVQ